MKPIQTSRTLFDVEYGIPIPGASVGGVGLKAVLGAKLDLGFQFGPVVIEPVTFEAGFNPLEDDPQLDLGVSGELKAPVSASLSASVSGGIKIDAFIAEVGGKITITGVVTLAGGLRVPFKGRYANKRLTVELTPEVQLGLLLGVGLSASVWAKAGVGFLSVKTSKTWDLGHRQVGTGLKLGLRAPVSYDSETGAKLPSADQVQLIKPDFSAKNLERIASELFSGAKADERES
jgi:hypothetical protein